MAGDVQLPADVPHPALEHFDHPAVEPLGALARAHAHLVAVERAVHVAGRDEHVRLVALGHDEAEAAHVHGERSVEDAALCRLAAVAAQGGAGAVLGPVRTGALARRVRGRGRRLLVLEAIARQSADQPLLCELR